MCEDLALHRNKAQDRFGGFQVSDQVGFWDWFGDGLWSGVFDWIQWVWFDWAGFFFCLVGSVLFTGGGPEGPNQ